MEDGRDTFVDQTPKCVFCHTPTHSDARAHALTQYPLTNRINATHTHNPYTFRACYIIFGSLSDCVCILYKYAHASECVRVYPIQGYRRSEMRARFTLRRRRRRPTSPRCSGVDSCSPYHHIIILYIRKGRSVADHG